jgi:uncharacterized protein (DUF1697 family)
VVKRWIALLRGVNVGGGNKIGMPALRASCEEHGLERVATYIQSGNLVFDADGNEATVTKAVRDVLGDRHGLQVPVVVREVNEMDKLADRHPGLALGIEPKYLHIHFLDKRVKAADTDKVDRSRYEPDTFEIDGREIYVTYPNGSGRSKLTIEVFERAFGVVATGRNLNTVNALIELGRG